MGSDVWVEEHAAPSLLPVPLLEQPVPSVTVDPIGAHDKGPGPPHAIGGSDDGHSVFQWLHATFLEDALEVLDLVLGRLDREDNHPARSKQIEIRLHRLSGLKELA